MAGQHQPSEDMEILAHVAAPSRTADDAVYRQLAQAYLSFQPESRTRLPDPDHFATPPPAPFGPDSQELSFRSAWDNRSSLVNRGPPLEAAAPLSSPRGDAPSQTSFCAPASQISDSYPLPDSGVLKATPTRILQRYLSDTRASTDTSASSPSPPPGRAQDPSRDDADAVDVPSSLPIPSHEAPQPAQTRDRLSAAHMIPVTPLTLTRKRKASAQEQDQSAFDVTHVSSSVVSHAPTSSPCRAESEPLPSTKPKNATDGTDSLLALMRSTSDTGPVRSSSGSAAVEQVASTLEIRPPSPPVGVAVLKPSDLVSEPLAKLARDLSSRYRPDAKRPTEPLERGYWLLDCRRWTPQTRLDTWVFLTNYLGSGLAGWGVWCRRDAARDWIRLYCWACVAKHAYLLLYLASGRQVKLTGARWFGADGEVALEVPAGERRNA